MEDFCPSVRSDRRTHASHYLACISHRYPLRVGVFRLCRSFLRLDPFSRFGSLFQSSQSRTPKPFDELAKLIEGFSAHHIQAPRSHSAFIDKSRFAQHAEVLGDGRSRYLELSCHRSRVHFAVADKPHDLEPSLVAQSPKLGQHGHLSSTPV